MSSEEARKTSPTNLDTCSTVPTKRVTRQSMRKMASPAKKPRYTTLAEQVLNFHHAAPPRFKKKSGAFKENRFLPTVPHSPRLQTKLRARQSIAVFPKPEEKPILKPRKVPTQAKIPPRPAPRPTTVPVPFNLTEPTKKEIPKPEATAAAATPRSKPIKKRTFLEIKDGELVVTKKIDFSGIKTINRPNRQIKVVPFSFEQREQERQKAKQKKMEEANSSSKKSGK